MDSIPTIRAAPRRRFATAIVTVLAVAIALQGIGYRRAAAAHRLEAAKQLIPGTAIPSAACSYRTFFTLSGDYTHSQVSMSSGDAFALQRKGLLLNLGLIMLAALGLWRHWRLAAVVAALALLIALISLSLRTLAICPVGLPFN
ncbi:MAG TPA: hypothetical protein VD886_11470 [Herpetosiphonaceae bacterium]|nr:hypothetical protein [Herpetosiphonaceae bacterium]